MRPEAKNFRGLWIEPLDLREYRWRCASCDWELEQEHGGDVPDALDAFLTHQCPGQPEITTTDRGLRGFGPFRGIDGLGFVDCQESSLATEPAIWVTVRGFNETSMATVQISREAAHELGRSLHNLAANHYHLRG